MSVADKLGFGPKRESAQVGVGWVVKVTPNPIFMLGAPPQYVPLTNEQYQQFKEWLAGRKMIQEALPDLTKDQREILMSGLGPEEFKAACGPEEED